MASPNPEQKALFQISAPEQKPPDIDGKPVLLGSRARIWEVWVHILPLGISIFAVYICLHRWYWFGQDGLKDHPLETTFTLTTTQNILQLVAKIHELLVVASLGALTLKIFRRYLVESHVPLGLVTAPYRVGDVQYFLSWPFWSQFGFVKGSWSPSHITHTGAFLGLLVLVNTIVATLIGPASAILIIPDLDWYPLHSPFQKMQGAVRYAIPVKDMWPQVIDPATALFTANEREICDKFESSLAWDCTNGGYDTITNWAASWESSGLSHTLLFSDNSGAVRRALLVNSVAFESADVTYTTTISMGVASAVGHFLNHINSHHDFGTISQTKNANFNLTTSGKYPIYQPLAQTQCAMHDVEALSPDNPPPFTANELDCFGDTECDKMLERIGNGLHKVPSRLIRADYDIVLASNMYEIQTTNGANDTGLTMAMRLPYLDGTEIKPWLLACTVIAHWVPSELTISPEEDIVVGSNITDPSLFSRNPEAANQIGPALQFTMDWIPYLDPNRTITLEGNSTGDINTLRLIFANLISSVELPKQTKAVGFFNPGSSKDSGSSSVSKPLAAEVSQRILGAYVTEALARGQSYGNTIITVSSNSTTYEWQEISQQSGVWQDYHRVANTTGANNDELRAWLDTLVSLDFTVKRYGYGSGKVGPTRTFALAVIYSYFGIVAVYFLYTMVLSRVLPGRRGRAAPTVAAWGDLQELLLLAWNSRAHPEISRSSVEVENPAERWRMCAEIRADEEGKVQLVTGDCEGDTVRLRRNARYH